MVHALWIGLGGVLVFLVVRRLLGGALLPAFLAGTFTIAWAPSDSTRLVPAHMFIYSGCTFGVLLAAWLALEAWTRRQGLLVGAAVVAGVVAVLSHEASLAPLALVPLLFVAAGGRRERRRLAVATLVVFGVLGSLALRAALPLWTDPERVAYQMQVQAADHSPVHLAARCLGQLRRHVRPLAEGVPPGGRAWPAVPLVLFAFALGLGACVRFDRRPADPDPGLQPHGQGRRLVAIAAGGVALALLAYLPFVASTQTRGAARTEFLSAPGVGAFLAATAAAVACLLPTRARPLLLGLFGAWVMALGTLRTTAFQADWDRGSPYRAQRSVLLGITSVAPQVVPGTLVVLLARTPAWPLDLTFRHAVAYLYEGKAVGHVPRRDPFLYETSFEPGGIRTSPEPVIRGPWHEDPRLISYDSVVVMREEPSGRVSLVEAWPGDLPPLPPGARYAPRGRILPGPRSRRVEILDR